MSETIIEETVKVLGQEYFTLPEAVERVKKTFPGWEFSSRQMARAVDSGKVPVRHLGRLRYIHVSDLNKFMNRLVQTSTVAGKLRYSQYVDPAEGILGSEGRQLPEDIPERGSPVETRGPRRDAQGRFVKATKDPKAKAEPRAKQTDEEPVPF